MAISRPVLIALVAAVVALGAFYATQGGRDEATDAAAPVVPLTSDPPAGTRDTASRDGARSGEPGKSSARSKARRERRRAEGVPIAVERALGARKRVVLFFYRPGSADDRATARAVDGLRGTPGVAVFSDPIGRIARYRGLIGELGISQAPAVVIAGKDRSARVVQGYVDPATLAQDVADTR